MLVVACWINGPLPKPRPGTKDSIASCLEFFNMEHVPKYESELKWNTFHVLKLFHRGIPPSFWILKISEPCSSFPSSRERFHCYLSHKKSSAPVGLQYAHHQDVCPGRQSSSSPRMHTGHRMRTTGTHTQSCAALGPSLPVVLLGHGDCSMEKTDREAWRWKNCSNQKGIREAGDSAKSETGIFFWMGNK